MGRKKKSETSLHAIFALKPNKGTNTALIKCVGHVEEGENVADEPLPWRVTASASASASTPPPVTVPATSPTVTASEAEHFVYQITDSIYARFYNCHLKDTFIMTTKTLPVMYASIMYKNELVCGLLMNIFVDFTIKSEVKTEKHLINAPLEGTFAIRIKINDTDPPKVIELDLFHGTDFMIETMIGILETEEMKAIIGRLMEERRRERMGYLGSMDDIEIPRPKYNFTELVKEYKRTGKIDM